MTTVILNPVHNWECPNCGAQDVTRQHLPHSRMHPCPALRGMTAPFVEVFPGGQRSQRSHVKAVVREDCIGEDGVRFDGDGRPIMAVVTERPDGSNDVLVFAPTASSRSL